MAAMIAAGKTPELAEAALPEAGKILANAPDYVPALMVSALVQEKNGDFPGAAQVYEKIYARDPFFAPAARRLAILYSERLGNDEKAEAFALKARKVFTNDGELDFELGLLNYRGGNFSKAIGFLQQSLAKRENDARTIFYLGMSHYELKNAAEAKSELKRALDLKLPEKDADDATRVLDQLERIDPNG